MRGIVLLALAGFGGYVLLAITLGAGFAIPVAVVGALSAAVILRGPLGKALADRLHGIPSGAPPDELFGELDDLRTRVVELEERVDFSERLLAQARDSGRLTPDRGAHE